MFKMQIFDIIQQDDGVLPCDRRGFLANSARADVFEPSQPASVHAAGKFRQRAKGRS